MAAQDWWVMAPAAASQGTPLNPVKPAGTIIINVDKGSPEDTAIANLQNVTIGGQSFKRFEGPFATQQQAQKASPPAGLQFIGTTVGIIGTAAATSAGGGLPGTSLGNPLSGIQAVGDFFARLTDLNTWIRVGEFVLGALLLIAGALRLSGAPADLRDIAKLTPVGKVL